MRINIELIRSQVTIHNLSCIFVIALTAYGCYRLLHYQPSLTPLNTKPAKPIQVYSEFSSDPQFTLNISLPAQVIPRFEQPIISHLEGPITSVGNALTPGSAINKGDIIATFKKTIPELKLSKAAYKLKELQIALERAKLIKEKKHNDWKMLKQTDDVPDLIANDQIALHQFAIEEAKIERTLAAIELENTEVKAPFDGKIREANIQKGSYVGKGYVIATAYSTTEIDILATLTADEQYLLKSATNIKAELDSETVQNLSKDTFCELDKISQYSAAYYPMQIGTEGNNHGNLRIKLKPCPLLTIGDYVKLKLHVEFANPLFKIPSSALVDFNSVFVITDNNTLALVDVATIHRQKNYSYVIDGLSEGDRIVPTPLPKWYEGMYVEVL